MPRKPDNQTTQQHALLATTYFLHLVGVAAVLYSNPNYWKQPLHTSALSGQAWVNELIHGHPDRIFMALGMRLHVFTAFCANLTLLGGVTISRHGVTVEEQAAIFLYTCVTGLSIRHVAERFQRSNETISKYFQIVLNAVSTGAFYNTYVHLPSADEPISDYIHHNPKFYPFFKNILGAIDGTHINSFTTAANRHASRDRKGGISQNCLAVCGFDFRFLYFISGFEGSVADATMYMHSRLMDFMIPHGKAYLADAGFALCDTLLTPYRSVRYHLAEWGRAGIRPANPQELFNLRHAQARNIIERIFGVLKKRWDILNRPPQFSMDIQAKIPPALAAVHNFIMEIDRFLC
ncbi:hypothetical protein D9613_008850 [Agrocybe pediades]|uniref:DDE Tnp4 domain-containing protein n=1 Tax=Agrocybe pediades TaxID=84607 RepID=A0A8H4VQL5_9AGAR|nr:hypothetical protein D9613_008850 [Agrocybe pediades]